MTDPRPEPVSVDLREAEVLAVARALVTPDAYASIEGTLASEISVTKLGPSAMAILKSTLAKGVVKMLARSGAAQIKPRPGSERPARVFSIRKAPGLAFGPYSFEVCRWLARSPLHVRETAPPLAARPETLGDQIVAYLALRLVAGYRLERVVASVEAFRCPLTWLAFPRALARWGPELDPADSALGAGVLVESEDGRTVLESLASDLALRWVASTVWDEYELLAPDVLLRIGRAEHAVVGQLLDAVERAGRWDLATFLLDAGLRTVVRGVSPRDLAIRALPAMQKEASLRVRSDARRQAGALYRALGRIEKKRDALALVRFIDDGYEEAQAILRRWEPFGRDAFARAGEVVALLESLDPLGPAPLEEPAPTKAAQKV